MCLASSPVRHPVDSGSADSRRMRLAPLRTTNPMTAPTTRSGIRDAVARASTPPAMTPRFARTSFVVKIPARPHVSAAFAMTRPGATLSWHSQRGQRQQRPSLTRTQARCQERRAAQPQTAHRMQEPTASSRSGARLFVDRLPLVPLHRAQSRIRPRPRTCQGVGNQRAGIGDVAAGRLRQEHSRIDPKCNP